MARTLLFSSRSIKFQSATNAQTVRNTFNISSKESCMKKFIGKTCDIFFVRLLLSISEDIIIATRRVMNTVNLMVMTFTSTFPPCQRGSPQYA